MATIKNAPGVLLGGLLLFSMLAVLAAVQLASAHLRWGLGFEVGDVLSSAQASMTIEALDLIEEPGEIVSGEELALFFQRQAILADLLAGDELHVTRNGTESSFHPRTMGWLDLPALFWIQVIVGFGAVLISGWIWSLRSRDWAARLFALSGVSTLMFTFAAAIYTTRELALPLTLFQWLRGLNELGASLFGMVMIALFLIYPVPLRHWRGIMLAQVLFFATWTVLSMAGLLPGWANVNLITLCEMIGICIALGGQFFATQGNPAARASLSWLGLSVLVGAGGFIVLNALPLVLGTDVAVSQGYAFLLFLVIYLGLAAGITRYRLFDVGNWAFRFLFYSLGALLLVLLDAAFIAVVGLERIPALGLAFFIIGFFYLPLRDFAGRLLRGNKALAPHELVDAAMHVAMAPMSAERASRWRLLISQLFDPLEVKAVGRELSEVSIGEDGTSLLIPAVAGAPALQARYPRAGKTLFSQESVRLAAQLVKLIAQVEASRDSYERGVREERGRIAQDLHDDVGARLLTGLHAGESGLRAAIEGAMADIRAIVKGIAGEAVKASELLADLRMESLHRLESAGITLKWPIESYDGSDQVIDYRHYKALGSLLREAVSNVIKHSRATAMTVAIDLREAEIRLCIEDDGVGYPESMPADRGFGLNSIRKRVADLAGHCQFSNSDQGARMEVVIPIKPR